ncbi:MAG: hypothetical protein LBL25_00705 [Oscillospiraceae bacterium]|nr:hypothetical protein [Oscillospiraceae bacterium]
MAAKPSAKPKTPILIFKTKSQKSAFKAAARASWEAQQKAPKFDFSRVKRIGFGESDTERPD